MRVPTYDQQLTPTGQAGVSKSLAGEKRSPMNIPNTEAAKWSALKKTSDKLFNIGQKISEAEDAAEYNDALIKLKEGYAQIKNDLKTNPDYNEYSVSQFEQRNEELSTELQSNVIGGMKKYKAKKQIELAA